MDRLTRKEIEAMRSYDPNIEGPLTRKGMRIFQAICDLALQSLSQEAVRDEALEEVAQMAQDRAASAHDDFSEFAQTIRALKREPNAAQDRCDHDVSDGTIHEGTAPQGATALNEMEGSTLTHAVAAGPVAETVRRLREAADRLNKATEGYPTSVPTIGMLLGQAATLLAKFGQIANDPTNKPGMTGEFPPTTQGQR